MRCHHLVVFLLFVVSAFAQGVQLRSGAEPIVGSASHCSRPGTIDFQKVMRATPEYKQVNTESIDRDSARYKLLRAEMHERIKRACEAAARAESVDCVARKDDVADPKGLKPVDLTQKVIEALEA